MNRNAIAAAAASTPLRSSTATTAFAAKTPVPAFSRCKSRGEGIIGTSCENAGAEDPDGYPVRGMGPVGDPKPFLLENNVSYIQYIEQDFDEPRFLNEICSRSRCGLLLDLHNLYVDRQNGVVDTDNFLALLDLSHVVEVHLAGGLTYDGVYLDAHSGAVPSDVWSMAENILPRCPNIRGITFELLGSWFERMGESALLETIARMRDLANRLVVKQFTLP